MTASHVSCDDVVGQRVGAHERARQPAQLAVVAVDDLGERRLVAGAQPLDERGRPPGGRYR